MSKRQQKTESAIIYGGATTDEVYMALLEQLLEMRGPTAIERLFAERLRDPEPNRAILDTVARWLDPQNNYSLALGVVRRRCGKTWTKHVNDAAVAGAVLKYKKMSGDRRGIIKKIVGKVAEDFKISEAKVRQVIRSK
jgi:hypothetical protein